MREDLTFGNWLRRRRKELSITQEELAERLDISWITLRKLESGERHPSGQIALLLADHLRVPSDERHAFVAFARTGRQAQGEVSPSAPWRNTFVQQTNLPTLLAPIIGRDKEVAAAVDYLLSPKTRLLTLTGAPGIGKTRLGLQVALDLLANFEDGVYFVDLSSITDPDLVLPTIAGTLALKGTSSQPVESVLLDYLRQKRTLLMLDNFEQVLDASKEVVKMMNASPWLKVLVTSREALQVRGERRFIVPPLELPDLHQLPGPDQLAGYSAVELFIERAQAIVPDFRLIEANIEEVAAICVGLEGLPLAIEIAASRAGQLSLAEMRTALASRLKLLRAEIRDLPTRQRTLRGAIEWSYSLLSKTDKRVLAEASVFVGGFTAGAAEAVCSPEVPLQQSEPWYSPVVGHLISLVSKNLLQRMGTGASSGASEPGEDLGEARFGFLETIRDYALECLEEGAQDAMSAARLRHGRYFLRFVEGIEPRLTSNEQGALMALLGREQDNIRAALTWSFQAAPLGRHGDSSVDARITTGIRMVAALWRYWLVQGLTSEGRHWVRSALLAYGVEQEVETTQETEDGYWHRYLAQADDEEQLRLLLKILQGAGALANMSMDFQASRFYFSGCLVIAEALEDSSFITQALNGLRYVAIIRGNNDESMRYAERILELKRRLGQEDEIALALNGLAQSVLYTGDSDRAYMIQTEAVALARRLGSAELLGRALSTMGIITFHRKDYAESRTLNMELLEIATRLGHKEGMLFSMRDIGVAFVGEGDFAAALPWLRKALAIAKGGERPLLMSETMVRIAQVYAAQEMKLESARLHGLLDRLERDGTVIFPMDSGKPDVAELERLGQGDSQWATAFIQGQSMSMEQGVALAMGEEGR